MADVPSGSARRKGILLLISIFLVGMVCGAALLFMGQHSAAHFAHWRVGPGGPPRHDPIGHLTEMLALDDDQVARAHEILDRNRREMHDALETTHEELLELLDDEQRARFDELRPRHHRGPGRRGHMGGPLHHRPPPPPPPPDSAP